ASYFDGTYLLETSKHNEASQSVIAGLGFSTLFALLGAQVLYLGAGSKFRSA
ncbi:unnamed protein product, partial [Amoebophrya sp. A25]